MTVRDAFLEYVVPILGGIVGVSMFASPFKAVLKARRERVLGDLNPLPFPAIFANCAGWVGYGFVIRDWLVYWPNEVGLLIGLFFTLSCYGLADTKTRDRQLAIMLFFTAALSIIGAVSTLANMSRSQLKSMWGFTANAILLIYYAAPLSTILTVIKTRNSASLHLPLAIMNTINGVLWLVYGLAVQDYFIAVPNGIGAVLGLVLVGLIFAFPSKRKQRSSPAVSDDTNPSSQQPFVPGGQQPDSGTAQQGSSAAGASPEPSADSAADLEGGIGSASGDRSLELHKNN